MRLASLLLPARPCKQSFRHSHLRPRRYQELQTFLSPRLPVQAELQTLPSSRLPVQAELQMLPSPRLRGEGARRAGEGPPARQRSQSAHHRSEAAHHRSTVEPRDSPAAAGGKYVRHRRLAGRGVESRPVRRSDGSADIRNRRRTHRFCADGEICSRADGDRADAAKVFVRLRSGGGAECVRVCVAVGLAWVTPDRWQGIVTVRSTRDYRNCVQADVGKHAPSTCGAERRKCIAGMSRMKAIGSTLPVGLRATF